MKYLVPLILLFFTLAFWLAVDQKANDGRRPEDEQVVYGQERDKVTGELYNTKIIKCRICGQVTSYVHYNLKGKVIHASVYFHHCGPYAKYTKSVFWQDFNFIDWLDKWQKRLRIQR